MLLRRLEETAMNAWPALHQMLYDGWVLRFSQGYTKRANSANPLYDSALDLDEKISHCEALFAAQGLPCVFRLPSFCAPPNLDATLEQRGYEHHSPSLVQHLDLTSRPLPDKKSCRLDNQPLDEWIGLFCRLKNASVESHQTHKQIVNAILAHRFQAALLDENGMPVSCGLAVLEGNMVWLFDLITDPARRGQGYGTALVAGLLSWAKENGATHAYLQVEQGNTPARHLYEITFGFQTVYHYWYRVQHQANSGKVPLLVEGRTV